VRGLVQGYQKGTVNSFSSGQGIDQVYVDGVSNSYIGESPQTCVDFCSGLH